MSFKNLTCIFFKSRNFVSETGDVVTIEFWKENLHINMLRANFVCWLFHDALCLTWLLSYDRSSCLLCNEYTWYNNLTGTTQNSEFWIMISWGPHIVNKLQNDTSCLGAIYCKSNTVFNNIFSNNPYLKITLQAIKLTIINSVNTHQALLNYGDRKVKKSSDTLS